MGAVALVVPGTPAAAAEPPPVPGEVVAGAETDTPALVRGIREEAPARGGAADAARTYLDGRQERYRIEHPERDLVPAGTTTSGDRETVRLQQRHHGVPVLGGQYIVRMEKDDGERVVTGTSGKYFTGLTTGTTAGIDEELAVERAVDRVLDDLGDRHLTRAPAEGEEDSSPLEGTAKGLVVVPRGTGVLTQHVTVRGADPATGEPVLREVYVDAAAGYPVLDYSGIKTFTAPSQASGGEEAARKTTAAEEPSAAAGPDVPGSGVRLDGTTVPLDVFHDEANGRYLLRDRTRLPIDPEYEYDANTLSTFDGRNERVSDVVGSWPVNVKEFNSPTPEFTADTTEAGAVDAHWAAAKVFDYYKNDHDRLSLDGRGMAIFSLVGVTDYGQPYVNAFWDGQKMVYGGGDEEYRPLSSALDVVGHEMTHGVVENSANLVYAGQSGAMNEAVADYFGNAIETDVYGLSMTDPDSGLLGERLCRTKGPRDCAVRDLGDGRTTTRSFLGLDFANDNGGVHYNSTIFGGALWDIRQDLGGELADRIVYRALTEYLTPLDGFTEGRAAVLAAAADLGVPADATKALVRAFNAHGIVPGWELALGVDSDPLLDRINTTSTAPGTGGGWWAASKSNEDGSEAYSVWAGRTDGTGGVKLMSPNDGRYHVNPATDGKTVVWQAYGSGGGVDVLARPLAGGPVRTLWHGRSGSSVTAVDGDVVTFGFSNVGGRSAIAYLSLKDPTKITRVGGGTYSRAYSPSVSGGKVVYRAWQRVALSAQAVYEWRVVVADVATGTTEVIQEYPSTVGLGPTAVNGTHVFWLLDEFDEETATKTSLRRAALDGSGAADLSPETGPDALYAYDLTVSQDRATVAAYVPEAGISNEATPKLHQFEAAGTPGAAGTYVGRVSCNRGAQTQPAAGPGGQVVWLDSTTGTTDLVTRTRPTGRCG
ncbi:M4 family metallopeptidase [Streptomyces sp. CRN 30]|uniref:M4 family metallopeptidase n=1 Tax=Streptomyces sp. CRN 30 TaxID=3075613 RepID=UPI0039C1CDD1